MRIVALLFLLVLVGACAFVALNWAAITAPAPLSLLVTSLQASPALVILALAGALLVMAMALAATLYFSGLFNARRHAAELRAQRERADAAETSRFIGLGETISTGQLNAAAQSNESKAEILARLERMESGLRESVEQSGNTLAAYIGELEDRLEGKLPRKP